MVKKYILRILVLNVFMLLTACQASSPQVSFPTMTFKHLPTIKLRVVDIQLVSNFERNADMPHVAHRFPISPEKALIQWATDRIRALGGKNTARLTITQADAQEIKLKLDKNFTGIFKNQQSDRYITNVKAQLEILDEHGRRKAIVTAQAEQSITVAESTSLADRRKIWYNLVEKLITRFNLSMQENINSNLQYYLL
jgi:hypothetical protein